MHISDDTETEDIGYFKRLYFRHVHDFAMATKEKNQTPETKALLQGSSSILLPIQLIPNFTLDPDLEKQVEQGRLAKICFSTINKNYVIAQHDKKADGEELNARYYGDGTGYSDLKGDEWSARIGDLLGYTSNDIAWSNGTKSVSYTHLTLPTKA